MQKILVSHRNVGIETPVAPGRRAVQICLRNVSQSTIRSRNATVFFPKPPNLRFVAASGLFSTLGVEDLHVRVYVVTPAIYILFRSFNQTPHVIFLPHFRSDQWSHRHCLEALRQNQVEPPPETLEVRI